MWLGSQPLDGGSTSMHTSEALVTTSAPAVGDEYFVDLLLGREVELWITVLVRRNERVRRALVNDALIASRRNGGMFSLS